MIPSCQKAQLLGYGMKWAGFLMLIGSLDPGPRQACHCGPNCTHGDLVEGELAIGVCSHQISQPARRKQPLHADLTCVSQLPCDWIFSETLLLEIHKSLRGVETEGLKTHNAREQEG